MSSFSPIGIPMLVLPLTFLFVLLIVLITKAPRAGSCVVGGLVFLAPVLLWAGFRAGMLSDPRALPLIIIPATFLFVLLLVLLSKAPKAAIGLIVAMVVMGLLGLFVGSRHTVRQEATSLRIERDGTTAVVQIAPQMPTLPAAPFALSPIWSEGVEREMKADVYPSKAAAVRALGSRLDKPIRMVTGDVNLPAGLVVFQEEHDHALIMELCREIERTVGRPCVLESRLRNLEPNEVGITLRLVDVETVSATREWEPGGKSLAGRIEANVLVQGRQTTVGQGFVEKPWVDAFATVASIQPDQHLVVARSRMVCANQSEANQQAMNDARAQLAFAIDTRGQRRFGRLAGPEITVTDVLQGGFIVDRFVQSFEGSVGKIWRQALLLDISGPKLEQLARQKAREARAMEMSWARMGLSVVGVLVLIGVIYFFLNMATMGYYEWSLRIAGVVLAIVAIVSILMIVQ